MNRQLRTLIGTGPALALTLFQMPPAQAAELLGPAARIYTLSSFVLPDVAVGDFNADGVLDLAVANEGNWTVSLLLGDGLGGFSSPTDFEVAPRPVSLAVGDFNGDGAQDLAVAHRSLDSVGILLGDGHGGFSRAAEYQVGSRLEVGSVAVGDFNADGALDLAVAGGSFVAILLGDGRGGFSPTPVLPVYSEFVVVADFNADGALDLAVSTHYLDNVQLLLGDGLGGFFLPTDFQVGASPRSMVVGDFNADGAPDLVVANGGGDTVSLLLGDGLGGFSLPTDFQVGASPRSMVVGDFNADGAPDLVVAGVNEGRQTVILLVGDGLGAFSRAADFQIGAGTLSVAVGDFNADGALDLAVASGATVSPLLGDGLGGFSRAADFRVGDGPRSVAVGDFNADGALDLAVANFGGQPDYRGGVSLLLGDRLGGFSPAADLQAGFLPSSVAVGDFNADRALDLAVANYGSNSVSVLLGDGHGSFSPAADFLVGDSPGSVAVGDFNADGAPDLVVANGGGDTVSLLLGDGLGGFFLPTDFQVGASPRSVAVGDFNADGALDLAVANSYGGSLSILVGDGHGGFSPAADFLVGGSPWSVAVGDFNSDEALDLAVANYGSYTVNLLLGDGLGGFSRTAEVPVGGVVAIAIADFNGDDFLDVAVTWPDALSVRLLLGDGLGGLAKAADLQVGVAPFSVAVGDVNADGALDLVVGNYGSRTVSVLLAELGSRADINGSNRIDGFDVAAIARLAGAQRCPPDKLGCTSAYRRNEDVNLDGIIDGEDLALVAHGFGQLRKAVSPLHGAVGTSAPPSTGTVTLQQVASEADLLTVQVLVSDTTDGAAGASFAVKFDPTDGVLGQVLEVAGFDQGTYLSGDGVQAFDVDTKTPGMAKVTVSRLPNTDQTALGAQPLMSLHLRARRTGHAKLDFAPLAYSQPAVVNASGQQVPVTFVGGNAVTVDASGGGPPGQQLGFFPDVMNFSSVSRGSASRKVLRISNFGYSDLEVSNLTSTLPEFSSFFTSAFTVPPYGYIEMPVLFTPARKGWFSGELVIASNDAAHRETRVPVEGESDASLAVVPDHLTFGNIAAGSTKVLALKLTNRGTTSLTLTGFQSSDGQFVPQLGFTTLDPGQTGQVTVQFTPTASAVVRGTLTLSFDAPDATTVVVGMVGAGY